MFVKTKRIKRFGASPLDNESTISCGIWSVRLGYRASDIEERDWNTTGSALLFGGVIEAIGALTLLLLWTN